jgi:hypothetical protein
MTNYRNYLHQAPVLTNENMHVTHHAAVRALDMALEASEVRAAIMTPEFAYFSRKHAAWAMSSGRVTACVGESREQEGKWAVLSFVWRTEEDWREDQMLAPLPKGRRGVS